MTNKQQATGNTTPSTMVQNTEIEKDWPPDDVTNTILYLFSSVETVCPHDSYGKGDHVCSVLMSGLPRTTKEGQKEMRHSSGGGNQKKLSSQTLYQQQQQY
eukprot:15365600-Ditylum_brightwellii.AAC.2